MWTCLKWRGFSDAFPWPLPRSAEDGTPGASQPELPGDAGAETIARLDRVRNAAGPHSVADIRRNLQKTMQADAAVFRTQARAALAAAHAACARPGAVGLGGICVGKSGEQAKCARDTRRQGLHGRPGLHCCRCGRRMPACVGEARCSLRM